MSDPDFTLLWAKLVLHELVRCGVQHVCVAPGSRSTPLINVVDELRSEQQIQVHPHFDERGLGFYALGLAKRIDAPVAVIVTSGTAVANLLPAVTEAFLTKEKLILLTADRPQDLVACGANQAIEQKGIFSSHVTDAVFLPVPSMNTPAAWILSRIDEALYKQQQLRGPVQINCPYAVPFYQGNYEAQFNEYIQPLGSWFADNKPFVKHSALTLDVLPVYQIPDEVWNKKGIIIVGAITHSEQVAVKAFARATGWPIFTDIQSGLVSDWCGYDVWLTMPSVMQKLEALQVVIQFGTRLVSPKLDALLQDKHTIDYYLIDENCENKDPAHRRVNYIHAQPTKWIQAQSFEAFSQCEHSGWGGKLKYYVRKTFSYIDNKANGELALVQKIDTLLPQNAALFLGNSTIIRLFNNFATHSHPYVYANRGASGIDGLIASAIGVANGAPKLNQPTCAVIGDLSALHDLNSIALLTKIKQPFVLVISNNAGGAIFDRFPIQEHLEDLYQMYHDFNFASVASMFGINYIALEDPESFARQFSTVLTENRATIIEYITPAKATHRSVERISNKLSTMEKLTLVKE